MKWTKPSVLVLLIIVAAALIDNEGVVNAAAYIFIAFAIYMVYFNWTRKL
jgi:hypothetical protein